MEYCYRGDVLEQLLRHGVRPAKNIPPERVHEFVSDLYRYELRALRDCLLRGEVPKASYYARVVELRRRYPLLGLRPRQFLVQTNE